MNTANEREIDRSDALMEGVWLTYGLFCRSCDSQQKVSFNLLDRVNTILLQWHREETGR